jgi:hypothetical protein
MIYRVLQRNKWLLEQGSKFILKASAVYSDKPVYFNPIAHQHVIKS